MPRENEDGIARRLCALYPPDRWAVLRQVRSALGGRVEGLRVADVIAVALWPSMGPRVEVVEIKCSASDFDLETKHPEKGAPFARFASRRWFAVGSPWFRTVKDKALIPAGWGLYSVGTGKPQEIVPAPEVTPEIALGPFVLSLLRAASRGAPTSGDAPMQPVLRPLARGRVALACHHATLAPKKPGDRLPCTGCLEKLPTDPEAIEAAIGDASAEQLERYRRAVEEHAERLERGAA